MRAKEPWKEIVSYHPILFETAAMLCLVQKCTLPLQPQGLLRTCLSSGRIPSSQDTCSAAAFAQKHMHLSKMY